MSRVKFSLKVRVLQTYTDIHSDFMYCIFQFEMKLDLEPVLVTVSESWRLELRPCLRGSS